MHDRLTRCTYLCILVELGLGPGISISIKIKIGDRDNIYNYKHIFAISLVIVLCYKLVPFHLRLLAPCVKMIGLYVDNGLLLMSEQSGSFYVIGARG